MWCKCANLRIIRWDVSVELAERFGHYSLEQMPPVPALKILTTICSAVVNSSSGLIIPWASAVL